MNPNQNNNENLNKKNTFLNNDPRLNKIPNNPVFSKSVINPTFNQSKVQLNNQGNQINCPNQHPNTISDNNQHNKQNPQNQNKNPPNINQPREHKEKNPNQMKLKYAYDLYIQGQKDYKAYSLELALDRFEKAMSVVNEVYPKIKNEEKLLKTTDDFKAKLENVIKITQYQIKHK